MTQELEFLPQDIAQLLARGAAMVEPPDQVRARLRQRLTSTVAVAGPVGFIGTGVSRWSRFQGLAATAGASRALVALAGFVAGAATVLALRSTPTTVPPTYSAPVAAPAAVIPAAEVPSPELHRVAPSQSQAAVEMTAPVVHRRAPTRAIEVAVAEKATPGSTSPNSLGPNSLGQGASAEPEARSALEAEGELLQKGRTAMVRGDGEGALAAVEEHAARFPQGKLAEEREAIRIQVLVAEDRDPEARTALGAFRRNYPKSLLGPALEEAVVGKIQ